MTRQSKDIGTKIWTLKAHTDVWTGDCNGNPNRLITISLLPTHQRVCLDAGINRI